MVEGTLLSNIDPFNLYEKFKIIEALKKSLIWDSGLFKEKSSDDEKLNFTIKRNGSNLSVGQK